MTQLVACHLAGRSSNTVRFIDDNQIPAAVDDGVNSLLVVFFHTLIRPTGVLLDRLNGVHRGDDLIELAIYIVGIREAADRIII